MPLEDKKNETVEKDTSPLKTEEIINILNKTDSTFLKSNEITGNIKSDFKAFSITQIAQEAEKKFKKETEDEIIDQKTEKLLSNLENINSKEKELEKEQNEEVIPEVKQKIYSQEEANEIANELAKKYYQNGYQNGVKKIKEELQKGETAIAMSLKNTIDNLFLVSPDLLKKLNQNINNTISDLCTKFLGYEIERMPKKFTEKIEELVTSIAASSNKVKVYLNEEDHKSVTSFLKINKPNSEIEFLIDKDLENGDLKIKSGGIEVNEVFSKKINFFSDHNIKEQITTIEKQNASLKTNNKNLDQMTPTNKLALDKEIQNNSLKKNLSDNVTITNKKNINENKKIESTDELNKTEKNQ